MRRIGPAVIVVALLAAACGSAGTADGVASLADEPPSAPETPPTTLDQEAAILAFTQCLREQGLDVADPEVDADGNLRPLLRPARPQDIDREEAAAAREACAEYLDAIALGFERVDRGIIEDLLVEYAACMRDNGVDMPDPGFDDGPGPGQGPGGGPFGEIDRDDPAFQEADGVCRSVFTDTGLGDGPRGGGFGPPPGAGDNGDGGS